MPLFDGDKFIGNRSLSTIEALYSRGLVELVRNKSGRVIRAVCVPLARNAGEGPDQRMQPALEAPQNQRYSFRDKAIVRCPWDLKRLNGKRVGVLYAAGANIADFTVVVSDCLRTNREEFLPNLRLLARILNNGRMPDGSLFLLLAYQAPENGHRPQPLVLTRIDHQPTVNYVAGFASTQARKREDAESRELAQVLSMLLGSQNGA